MEELDDDEDDDDIEGPDVVVDVPDTPVAAFITHGGPPPTSGQKSKVI